MTRMVDMVDFLRFDKEPLSTLLEYAQMSPQHRAILNDPRCFTDPFYLWDKYGDQTIPCPPEKETPKGKKSSDQGLYGKSG